MGAPLDSARPLYLANLFAGRPYVYPFPVLVLIGPVVGQREIVASAVLKRVAGDLRLLDVVLQADALPSCVPQHRTASCVGVVRVSGREVGGSKHGSGRGTCEISVFATIGEKLCFDVCMIPVQGGSPASVSCQLSTVGATYKENVKH